MPRSQVAQVSLVGAGPGDPGLLTLRGRQLLELADVVVYDSLINPRLLVYGTNAEKIFVGKRAAAHTLSQEQINALLIEKARQGKQVVRLKGGDPFVFGRGGEECEALAKAGIRFEIVPGITAAIAACAYAGIPITHRDLNSSFTLITGHEREDQYQDDESRARAPAAGSSDIDWSAIAKLPCVAFYMGVKSLPRITARLIEHGMSRETPAATVQSGTMPRQRTVVATLGTIAERVAAEKIAAPAITIIGEVVRLRESINWFETRPLYGETIVVTRTRQQASDLGARLEELGAEVLEAPTIEVYPSGDRGLLDAVLARLDQFDWVVFTSANGVEATKTWLLDRGRDVRAFSPRTRFAAVGAATARAMLNHLGLRADAMPAKSVAEALADALHARGDIAGKRFLLLRADIARPILVDRLRDYGAAEVVDVPVYETRAAKTLPQAVIDALRERRVRWVTFTSSSTARNFLSLLGHEAETLLKDVKLASIGPVTTDAVQSLGLNLSAEAHSADIDSLVDAMVESVKTPAG